MPEVLLNQGKVAGQAINAAANYDFDPVLTDHDVLTIMVDMTGAAPGDVGVAVQPYEIDGVTVMPVSIPALAVVGPTLSGGHVYYWAQYDVSAHSAVRIRLTNNNAGPQTITRASWKLRD